MRNTSCIKLVPSIIQCLPAVPERLSSLLLLLLLHFFYLPHNSSLLKSVSPTRHWRDSRSREEMVHFFYLELENWMFFSRDVLDCQGFEKKILVLLSKFEILKKISLSLLDWMRFCEQILFLRVKILRGKKLIFFSQLFPQFLFQFYILTSVNKST